MNTNKPFNIDFIVSDGDWGGQVYFTIPKSMIHKDAQVIALTRFVDEREWDCNELDGYTVYEMNPYSDSQEYGELMDEDYDWNIISGGCGGGVLLEDSLWIHPDIPESLVEIIKSHLLSGKSFS